MLKTSTPTVAQSLVGSSLISIETWPVCGAWDVLELEPPQPERIRMRADRKPMNTRVSLEFIEFSLRSLRQFRSLLFLSLCRSLVRAGPLSGVRIFRPVIQQN